MSKECDGKMLFNIKSLMLPLDSITEFGDECYAHLSEDETQKETLTEHTRRCQKYWFNIVEAKHSSLLLSIELYLIWLIIENYRWKSILIKMLITAF